LILKKKQKKTKNENQIFVMSTIIIKE